jgi:pimeloyl-ACP methyl ester carboxylesterase
MMKNKLLVGMLIFTLLMSSCKSSSPTPTLAKLLPTPGAAPTTAQPVADAATSEPAPTPAIVRDFQDALCPFELPPDQVEGRTVECGYLLVPEDRSDPHSPTLRLAVAIFHPPGGAVAPDPIIYLSGGPGGSALEFIRLSFEQFAPVLDAQRDLILFDQRGIGLSDPALDCPERLELSLELLDSELDGRLLEDQEIYDLFLQSIVDCGQDLAAVANLSAYNTIANAADVNDLRVALGYEQVNLWGASYGTRLALGVMRDFPQGLRSVVLDSTYPPDVDLYLESPANVERATSLLFQSCAADPACNAAFPDLRAVFFDTVDRLNENPLSFQVTNPLTNESYDALLDGDSMLALLFQFLYITEVLPSLPQIIYDASQGDLSLITLLYGSLLAQAEAMSIGMQFSVQCNEEFAFTSLQEFETALAQYPQWNGMFEGATVGKLGFDVCAAWDSGQADASENQPVSSDVPTLVMAGEFDPITPPAWGQRAAAKLANGYFFQYPGVGHGPSLAHDCPRAMMRAFLNDPHNAPDDACIAAMGGLQFVVPGAGAQTVEFEPLTSQEFGFSSLVPVGWQELTPTNYARGQSALDQTALLQEAAPVSASVLLEGLSAQFGLDAAPESAGSLQAGDLTWELYNFEVQGQAADLALAQASGQTYLILFFSAPDEHDELYQAVFMPVVEALKPLE